MLLLLALPLSTGYLLLACHAVPLRFHSRQSQKLLLHVLRVSSLRKAHWEAMR